MNKRVYDNATLNAPLNLPHFCGSFALYNFGNGRLAQKLVPDRRSIGEFEKSTFRIFDF